MLSIEGNAAVEVCKGWNKFRQLVPLLTNKDVSLLMRGKLYRSCAHSCMLHGSETWLVKKENDLAIEWVDMRMITWMYDVKVTEKCVVN